MTPTVEFREAILSDEQEDYDESKLRVIDQKIGDEGDDDRILEMAVE